LAFISPAAVRGSAGSPAHRGHGHSGHTQWTAGHTSQGIEEGRAALVELGEEAARILSQLLLLGE
jgi:hypothetical protein